MLRDSRGLLIVLVQETIQRDNGRSNARKREVVIDEVSDAYIGTREASRNFGL